MTATPNTGNDLWDANCVCAGQLIDCLGVPGGSALPGTACDDGNANTGNDLWDANCVCAGQLIDCLGPRTRWSEPPATMATRHRQRHLGCQLRLRRSGHWTASACRERAAGHRLQRPHANTGNDLGRQLRVRGPAHRLPGRAGRQRPAGTACNDNNANTGQRHLGCQLRLRGSAHSTASASRAAAPCRHRLQ
ncbi:MAG: hypothetical protein IPO79_16920 [Flavobacteriales bacterium]|nr:hypothetical protein [Flavobacteriales bacterium]